MLARADVCKLRKKIAQAAGGEDAGIRTVRGQGYALCAPPPGQAAPHLAEAGSPFVHDGPAEERPPAGARQAELDLLLLALLPAG